MNRVKTGLTAAALLVDAAAFNSMVDFDGSGVQTDVVWLLPPLVVAAAFVWPLLLLGVWARRQRTGDEGGDA